MADLSRSCGLIKTTDSVTYEYNSINSDHCIVVMVSLF